MSGYLYGEPEPTQNCPYCGQECSAEFVDIGVGMQQVTPFACEGCHAVQIGPYDEERPLTEQEIKTGWYEPQAGEDRG
jgi:MinD superfamily P-loop ATPase